MITFLVSILLLVAGYFIYGKIVSDHFGINARREVPAVTHGDGVDFIPLPTWKVFVIQFLNIAGLGPIFGAILGAAYGPAAYLWIVFGCIFMGGVHDFFSGSLSMRHDGRNMPDIVGQYLGKGMRGFMMLIVIFSLLSVGISFVLGPVDLLAKLTSLDTGLWLVVVFAYYILATLLPIDKIIGNIYPLLGGALLFMAVGVGTMMVAGDLNGTLEIQELTLSSLKNWHANPTDNILVPMLFIVVSCGAISGFHSTQSPMMARCLKNEKYARPVFYGAMIAEGVVAMIWAAAAMAYFGGPEGLNRAATDGIMVDGVLTKVTPAVAVNMICSSWLGKAGAVIAVLGVVVCPITSGDTAFRSLRLTISEILHNDQKPIKNRLLVSSPLFAIAIAVILSDIDFDTIWKYFGITNQIIATIILWTGAAYLIKSGKGHWICSVPASFLTFVCISYILVAPYRNAGLHLSPAIGYAAGGIVAAALFAYCIVRAARPGVRKH